MKAYITLLSTESYLPGVLVLNKSLKKSKSKYPLYCAISVNVNHKIDKLLSDEGIKCIRFSSNYINEKINTFNKSYSRWDYTFDKLQIWGLTQFEKIIFLDSDMLILNNIDSLFDCDAFSAVCAGHSYPGNESWKQLNSGLIIIEPDKKVEKELLDSINTVVKSFIQNKKNIGDQDVIHYYLSDRWIENNKLHLDEGYNIFADYLTYYVKHKGYSIDKIKDGKLIYVIHFIGRYKPWAKANVKKYVWLLKTFIRNPLYFKVYKLFLSYMK